MQEAGEFVLGTTDSLGELTDLTDEDIWSQAADHVKQYGDKQGDAANKIERTRDTLLSMRQANDEAGGSLQDTQRRQFELLKATQGRQHRSRRRPTRSTTWPPRRPGRPTTPSCATSGPSTASRDRR